MQCQRLDGLGFALRSFFLNAVSAGLPPSQDGPFQTLRHSVTQSFTNWRGGTKRREFQPRGEVALL